MRLAATLLALLALAMLFYLPASDAEDRPDLVVTTLRYSVEGEDEGTVVVPAGRDNGTRYRYAFYDNETEFPDNWEQSGFNDSTWDVGSAPFGDREDEGVDPATIWNDVNHTLVRHRFTLPEGARVLSATIDVAFDNYVTPYLNGHLVYEERGASYHGMEYWNNDGHASLDPDWFVAGKNVLAVHGRDTGGSGWNRQWLDLEIKVVLDDQSESPIVLGDEVRFKVVFANWGNASAGSFTTNLTIGGVDFDNLTVADLAANATTDWVFYWIPAALGDYNLTATVDNGSNVAEQAEGNNTLSRIIHVGYYAYNLSVAENRTVANLSETVRYNITVTNTGDVEDNLTLALAGAPGGWSVSFTPARLNLQPAEQGNVSLEITVDDTAAAGNYSLSVTARSQYASDLMEVVVASGRDGGTSYRYQIFSDDDDFPENWNQPAFNDTNWSVGAAPFGNQDNAGVSYGTLWQTDGSSDDYIIFRLNFTFSAEDPLNKVALNVAYNNRYAAYLNGHTIRNCLGYGGGCNNDNVEYWNRQVGFDPAWLVNGTNTLVAVGRDSTYQGGDGNQWIDVELIALTPRSSLWNFTPPRLALELEVLPVYNFSVYAPITHRELDRNETYSFELWLTNLGNVADTYDVIVRANDTVNFTLDENYSRVLWAQVREGATGHYTVTLSLDAPDDAFLGLNLTITSRNASLVRWVELTARTYIPPNLLPPRTHVNLTPLVNQEWFPVVWGVDADYIEDDTVNFTLYYQIDNGTGDWSPWQEWAVFTNLTARFHGRDGYRYRFVCEATDIADNREDKSGRVDNETLVDLTAPVTWLDLRTGTTLTNASLIALEWGSDDIDIVGYDLEVRRVYGGLPTAWNRLVGGTIERRYEFSPPEDGVYQFRAVADDQAGNRAPPAPQLTVEVDRVAPDATLIPVDGLTDAESVTLRLAGWSPDLANYTFNYALVTEGRELQDLLAWHSTGETYGPGESITIPLLDGNRYYFRLVPTDYTGNTAYRDDLTAEYHGDGSEGQVFTLPFPVVVDTMGADIEVWAEERGGYLDGGSDPALLFGNQYYLDAANGVLYFGDGSTGYKPAEGEVIRAAWSGYDVSVLVDRSDPGRPRNLNVWVKEESPEGVTVRIEFTPSNDDDIEVYRIYRATDASGQMTLVAELPADASDYLYSYDDHPPYLTHYFYEVVAVDRIGLTSPVMVSEIDLTPVASTDVITYKDKSRLPLLIALGVVLIGGLLFVAYSWRNPEFRNQLFESFRGGPPRVPVVLVSSSEPAVAAPAAAAEAAASPFHEMGDGELLCVGCGSIFPRLDGPAACPDCGAMEPAEPAEVATEPPETAAEPVKVVAEPTETAAEPVEASAEPVEVTAEAVAEPAEPAAAENLEWFTVAELRDRLRERGLTVTGRKAELIARLKGE